MYTYVAPTPGGADDLGSYTYTSVSPVSYNAKSVVLSANAAVTSNYPVAAVQTAYSNAAQGTLAAGGTTVTARPGYRG